MISLDCSFFQGGMIAHSTSSFIDLKKKKNIVYKFEIILDFHLPTQGQGYTHTPTNIWLNVNLNKMLLA